LKTEITGKKKRKLSSSYAIASSSGSLQKKGGLNDDVKVIFFRKRGANLHLFKTMPLQGIRHCAKLNLSAVKINS
jgi:hypothetical protein